MAPTDYDFNLTRTEIIERAFSIIGVRDLTRSLTGEESEQGRIALNALLKSWENRSVFLWTIVEATQVLTIGDPTYTLGNEVIALDKAWYRDGTQDIVVEVVSWRQYEEAFDKTASTGDPIAVALDYRIASPVLYVYPAPSRAVTLYMLQITRLQDMDTAGGNPQVPTRFLNALTYGLAHELSFEYGIPVGEKQAIERQYEKHFAMAKAGDRERTDYEFSAPAFPSGRYSMGRYSTRRV